MELFGEGEEVYALLESDDSRIAKCRITATPYLVHIRGDMERLGRYCVLPIPRKGMGEIPSYHHLEGTHLSRSEEKLQRAFAPTMFMPKPELFKLALLGELTYSKHFAWDHEMIRQLKSRDWIIVGEQKYGLDGTTRMRSRYHPTVTEDSKHWRKDVMDSLAAIKRL